jgi:hypothetical protein
MNLHTYIEFAMQIPHTHTHRYIYIYIKFSSEKSVILFIRRDKITFCRCWWSTFTSTYDQICDQICNSFSLILPHLSIAISTKAEFFFRRNNFVALSTIQVCVETSTKLSLHVSPPSSLVNPLHHHNYDETASQVQRTTVAITTKFRRNCDENL